MNTLRTRALTLLFVTGAALMILAGCGRSPSAAPTPSEIEGTFDTQLCLSLTPVASATADTCIDLEVDYAYTKN